MGRDVKGLTVYCFCIVILCDDDKQGNYKYIANGLHE